MKITLILGIVAVASVGLSGCASGPALENFPRRQIDRPFTLPDGVKSWDPSLGYEETRDNTFTSAGQAWVNPFLWRTSINDHLTLLWNVIPLGIQYQIHHDSDVTWGLGEMIGYSFSGTQGVEIRPDTSVYHRVRLGDDVALETSFDLVSIYNVNYFGWAATLNIGPLFQVTDTFALSPRILVSAQNNYFYYSNDNTDLFTEGGTNVYIPVGLKAMWSISRRVDLNAEYRLSAIGAKNGWIDNLIFGSLDYFW